MPTVTTDPIVLSSLLAELALRQLPCGGWAALASSSQPAIEPTCYSALALDSVPVGDIARAQDFLLRTQNPNGSWPVFPGDDQEGGWITSLVVMALRDLVPAIPARLQGLYWLLNCAGKEANWFWKWSFVLPIATFVSTQTNMAGHGSRTLSAGSFPLHSRFLL